MSDCLTAIWYIFSLTKHEKLDLTYIGDMPRKLMALSSWRFLQIPLGALRVADVIFVKRRDRTKELTHVGICVAVDRIFHCSFKNKGGVIISAEDFMEEHEQTLDLTGMIRHSDTRSPLGSPLRPGDLTPSFQAIRRNFSDPKFPGCSPPPISSPVFKVDTDAVSQLLEPGGVAASGRMLVGATAPEGRVVDLEEPTTPPALEATPPRSDVVARPAAQHTPPRPTAFIHRRTASCPPS